MEKIDIINNLIKIFYINIYTYFIYFKITNCQKQNNTNNFIILLSSLILSCIHLILIKYIGAVAIFPILLFLESIILNYITKNRMSYCMTVVVISFVMTYALYIVSVVISGTILSMTIPNINYSHSISLITIPTIMFFIIKLFFCIKRFKNGFYFLRNLNNISRIGTCCILFLGLVLLVCGLLQKSENVILNSYVFAGLLIIIITFIIWIRTQITIQYRDEMKNRTIDIQKSEIESQNKVIEELKQNNIKLSSVIHRYNNRFSALENAIINTLNKNNNVEFSKELSIMLQDLKKMSQNFSEEVLETTEDNAQLPTTDIFGIDNILKYMSECAIKNKIKFDLKINNKIDFLINNIITKEELETMLGDHIKDAIIAINTSNNGNRSIMVVIGIIDDAYEICIYDTGIEFEIKTLKNLGVKRVTTHKNDGGTGIGYMTTFNILREVKGSLIIQEYNSDNYYTKSVNIRFDGKNEYKICSYRANKLKEVIRDKRIIIEEK